MRAFIKRISLFLRVLKEKGFSATWQMSVLYVRSIIVKSTFNWLERLGFHITSVHFYEPIPDIRELQQRKKIWESESELIGIEMNVAEQLNLVRQVFPGFKEEYEFPKQKTATPYEFYLGNGYFEAIDAEVAHCMVRNILPRRVIEIGSGNSTYLLARACLLNKERSGTATELFVIDPNPNETVAKGFPGLTKLTQEKAENIELTFFMQLDDGDILFIDSSHVVRTGSDVNYLYLEILARLKPGVNVHVHDIFLPYEYPRQWVLESHRFWSEQYMMQAFLTYNYAYKVLWSGSYMHVHHPQELKATFPSYDGLYWPRSIWIRKKL